MKDPSQPDSSPLSPTSIGGAQVSSLIQGLEGDGQVDSGGEFTMDEGAALERMKRFALEDPYQYVLLLVQAAVGQGAQRISVSVDSDDMILEHDGEPYSLAALQNVFGSVFSSGVPGASGAPGVFGAPGAPGAPGARELGLGLNGALALGPRLVEVRSNGAGQASLLRLLPDGAKEVTSVEAGQAGTRIHVRLGLGVEVSKRAIGTLSDYGTYPEERLLQSRLADPGAEVLVNGSRIRGGLVKEDALAVVGLKGEGMTGWVGFVPKTELAPELRLCYRGVQIASQQASGAPWGFVAQVESDRLKRDLSLFDVVRDDFYTEALAAVEAARTESLHLLIDAVEAAPPAPGLPTAWARGALVHAILGHPTIKSGSREDRLVSRLAALPVFRVLTATEPEPFLASYDYLLSSLKTDHALFFAELGGDEHISPEARKRLVSGAGRGLCVLVEGPKQRAMLEQHLGASAVPAPSGAQAAGKSRVLSDAQIIALVLLLLGGFLLFGIIAVSNCSKKRQGQEDRLKREIEDRARIERLRSAQSLMFAVSLCNSDSEHPLRGQRCLEAARAYELGLGGERVDLPRARGYFLRACKAGEKEGCRAAERLAATGTASRARPIQVPTERGP